ncbi:MAG: dephospho-CoA kinase [Candidatus Zixiibacteriota bacterium]
MLIGITGQIGAGKTTAAKILASFGAAVIDADRIGRQVVERSAELRRKLVRAFGPEILTRTGRLKRKKVAALAFANQDAKKRLNKLVHPYLLKELRRRLRQKARQKEIVIVDAALLPDWHLDREMDVVLVIHASLKTRLSRLKARGISRRDALARQRAQLPYSEYRHRADRVILNNSSIANLRAKLDKWYSYLLRRTGPCGRDPRSRSRTNL